MTRSKLKGTCLLADFEPRNIKDALGNDSWIEAMNEEIVQIEKNKTWTIVPRPKDKNVIGTKWVFRNKLDEDGKVSRNKARLVCKGYAQEEGIDYGETFSPVANWKESEPYLHMLLTKDSKFIRWMSSQHSSMEYWMNRFTLNNLKVLLIQIKGKWSANYTRHCMV